MFLILAGSKLLPDDIWVKGEDGGIVVTETLPDWLSWFHMQLTDQYNLKRQCRNSIRRSLAPTRDINASISQLPLPAPLIAFLRLKEFDDLMLNFKHFQL